MSLSPCICVSQSNYFLKIRVACNEKVMLMNAVGGERYAHLKNNLLNVNTPRNKLHY